MGEPRAEYPIAVHLLDTQTGERAVYQTTQYADMDYEGGVFNPFWWEEGNGSCDCNRELFFRRARDEDEPDEVTCGDRRFRIERILHGETGELLYSEPHQQYANPPSGGPPGGPET